MSEMTVSNVEAEPQYDPYGRLVYSETDREAIRQLLDSDEALTPPGDTE
jgi:hypothetical protein